MDKKLQILLPSLRYINAVNVDMDDKIVLGNKKAELNEYAIRNVLSASEVFDAEREANEIYRIYGRIEWMSILNGITLNYHNLAHFFLPYRYSNSQSLLNKFDFYLVRPYTGYTQVNTTTEYIRYFQVIATPNDIDVFPAGFAKNIFNDPNYIFNVNVDIDISNYYDNFNFPITELYLYAQFKPKINSSHGNEILKMIIWNSTGGVNKVELEETTLNIGDKLKDGNNIKISDKITYNQTEFKQEQADYQKQSFEITCLYDNQTKILRWNYDNISK